MSIQLIICNLCNRQSALSCSSLTQTKAQVLSTIQCICFEIMREKVYYSVADVQSSRDNGFHIEMSDFVAFKHQLKLIMRSIVSKDELNYYHKRKTKNGEISAEIFPALNCTRWNTKIKKTRLRNFYTSLCIFSTKFMTKRLPSKNFLIHFSITKYKDELSSKNG